MCRRERIIDLQRNVDCDSSVPATIIITGIPNHHTTAIQTLVSHICHIALFNYWNARACNYAETQVTLKLYLMQRAAAQIRRPSKRLPNLTCAQGFAPAPQKHYLGTLGTLKVRIYTWLSTASFVLFAASS